MKTIFLESILIRAPDLYLFGLAQKDKVILLFLKKMVYF